MRRVFLGLFLIAFRVWVPRGTQDGDASSRVEQLRGNRVLCDEYVGWVTGANYSTSCCWTTGPRGGGGDSVDNFLETLFNKPLAVLE
jgi:hypothetical protein